MAGGLVRRLLAMVVVIAALGACSDGDGEETSGDDDDGVAGDNLNEEASIDEVVDHEGIDSVVPGSAELEAALLTLDDLPEGSIDLGRHYSGVEICGMRTEMPDYIEDGQYPVGAAAFAFDDEPIVPDVFEKIVVAPAGTGAEVFERASGLLDMNCSTGEADGLAFMGAIDLALPPLGDESVGRRVTIQEQASGTTIGIDVLYARAGDTILAVGVVEPEGQTDLLVPLATIAFDRATAR